MKTEIEREGENKTEREKGLIICNVEKDIERDITEIGERSLVHIIKYGLISDMRY